MTPHTDLPALDALKSQAKRLRARLARDGTEINHARSLEMIAAQYGYRNWNTLHAAIGNRPPRPKLALGERVEGRYLGQPFTGEIVGISALAGGTRFRTAIHFDEPVDVVKFDSFSAFRQRVSCTLDEDGVSPEKTSDGEPQMRLF